MIPKITPYILTALPYTGIAFGQSKPAITNTDVLREQFKKEDKQDLMTPILQYCDDQLTQTKELKEINNEIKKKSIW